MFFVVMGPLALIMFMLRHGMVFCVLTFLVAKSRVSHDWAEMVKLAISYLDPRYTNLNNKSCGQLLIRAD